MIYAVCNIVVYPESQPIGLQYSKSYILMMMSSLRDKRVL